MSDPISPIEVTVKAADTGWVEFLGHLIWPAVALVVVLVLRSELRALLQTLFDRLKSGAAIKLGTFEFGAINIARVDLSTPNTVGRPDTDNRRTKERKDSYARSRSVMIVHRLGRSRTKGQESDILVYLVPHQDEGTLASIERVEYLLGKSWKSAIYTSTNRYAGFPILLSAYGPTLCSAEIFFTDGTSTFLHRYLDFEMGASAPLVSDGPRERKSREGA